MKSWSPVGAPVRQVAMDGTSLRGAWIVTLSRRLRERRVIANALWVLAFVLGVYDVLAFRDLTLVRSPPPAVALPAHSEGYAEVDGVRIYYETFGAGPPVLVMHGGFGNLETMRYQIADLARTHRVIAPDSRGHGRSTDGPGPLRYADMADDMVALLDRLHVARADVVGWSDGGIIGLDLAMRHPERVGRVVAMGANFDPSGLQSLPAFVDPDGADEAGARASYRRLSPNPDHWPVFYGKMITMWRTEPGYAAADLARIRAPVLIMAGENDLIRRRHTDALAAAIPGARETIIPGADHGAPMEAPEAVNAAIEAFLRGAPPTHG